MAKKSRRAKARQGVSRANIQKTVVATTGERKAVERPSQVPQAAIAIKPNQYNYVTRDLITIGIISGSLILVLIILTFIPVSPAPPMHWVKCLCAFN